MGEYPRTVQAVKREIEYRDLAEQGLPTVSLIAPFDHKGWETLKTDDKAPEWQKTRLEQKHHRSYRRVWNRR